MKWLLSTSLLFTAMVTSLGQVTPSYSLEAFVNESEVLVEGEISSSESFFALDGLIYTRYTVKVHNEFIGDGSSSIEFISVGGEVGNEGLRVCPAIHFVNGDFGILGLRKVSYAWSSSEIYQPVSSTHSWISINSDQLISDHDNQIYSKGALHTKLSSLAKRPVLKFTHHIESSAEAAVTISSVTPLTTQAGRGQEITINGSGFGSSQGSGNVFFRNVDAGTTSLTVSGLTYSKWTDTQIKVDVPTRAGNGKVKVKTNSGSQSSPSSQSLTVTYNITNASLTEEIRHIDDDLDGNGGYNFNYSTSTANNGVDFTSIPEAIAAIERASVTWHNGSKFAIFTEEACGTTTAQTPLFDGTNLISFDNDAYDIDTKAGSSVLGLMFTYYSYCGSTDWELMEMDMIVRRDGNPNGIGGSVMWEYGPASPSGGETDFESVVLHELGHAHLLGHVRVGGAVMYPSIVTGTKNRTLSSSESTGGAYVQSQSTGYSPPIIGGCPSPFNSSRQYLDFDPNNICSIVLPLDLVSFEVNAISDKSIMIHWSTVNEVNHDHVVLEHSNDHGKVWQEISRFWPSENRPGHPADYRYKHEDLSGGIHMYRLKIIDKSRRYEYSDILSEQLLGDEESFNTFNSNGGINISYQSHSISKVQLSVLDMSGKRIYHGEWSTGKGINETILGNENWPAGLYLIKLYDPLQNVKYLSKQFIK